MQAQSLKGTAGETACPGSYGLVPRCYAVHDIKRVLPCLPYGRKNAHLQMSTDTPAAARVSRHIRSHTYIHMGSVDFCRVVWKIAKRNSPVLADVHTSLLSHFGSKLNSFRFEHALGSSWEHGSRPSPLASRVGIELVPPFDQASLVFTPHAVVRVRQPWRASPWSPC